MEHRFSLVLERREDGRQAVEPPGNVLGSTRVIDRQGVAVAEFQRSAQTLADAVLGAILETELNDAGWRVVRVEPDELVSASAIARRLGRSRQSVAQQIAGRRGPGGFPHPAIWVDGAARLWRFSDVAEWFSAVANHGPEIDRVAAEFLAMLNGELQARRHRERLATLAAPDLEPGSGRHEVEVAFPQLGHGRRWRGIATELGGGAQGLRPGNGP